jgi:4-aminobutyrate aminotransferase-like enzyme
MGLMQAIEIVRDEKAGDRAPDAASLARLLEETKKRGLLVGKGGLYGNVVRIAPPLTVGPSEVDEAISILGESFAAMGRG